MSTRVSARFALRTLFVATTALTFAACGGDDEPSGPGDADLIESWLESVEADGSASVSVVEAAAPAASGGPELDAELTGSFITGGTTTLSIAGEDFDGLVIALQGVDGYVDVEYDNARSSANVAITLPGSLPGNIFTLRIAGRDGSTVGAYVNVPVSVVQVGSDGPIQVSVSWDTPTDVDLHVIDPSGEEIYYAHDVSETGGELDLDSNAGCSIDNVNNENITWSDDDDPASGTYQVLVHYWSPCGQGTTNYIVTVRVEGEQTRTFAGTLTEDDELDEVTTFTY
ncbi:MAG TPA: hypothetical protein VF039_11765 [Longimicrobiales bacterium]